MIDLITVIDAVDESHENLTCGFPYQQKLKKKIKIF